MARTTIHPRLQVITVPRVRTVLERISVASGQSMATIVRDMLEQSLPLMEQLADALEAVPESPGAALAKMSTVLQQTSAEVNQLGLELGQESKTLVQRAMRKARQEARRKAARE